jgi:hypothetical protein
MPHVQPWSEGGALAGEMWPTEKFALRQVLAFLHHGQLFVQHFECCFPQASDYLGTYDGTKPTKCNERLVGNL